MFAEISFASALSEITLVAFTTLAPSGAAALAIMAVVLLAARVDDATRARINKFVSIPLVVTTVGLIASATHLGNPSNALYVLLGVGSSPLSNEVFCIVLFLGVSGIYWLYSFSQKPIVVFQKILQILIILFAVVFITAVAYAYSTETILIWNSPWVPVTLWLNAFVGGPLLATCSLNISKWDAITGRTGRLLSVFSLIVLAANVVAYIVQGLSLPSIGNSVASAVELVPSFWIMLLVFALFCLAGIALTLRGLGETKSFITPASGTLLAFAGIFTMRFAFYMLHMTVGLGLSLV